MSQKAKAIVFDLGGVIINLDKRASFQALDELANRPQGWDWSSLGEGFFSQFERGEISPAEFRRQLRSALDAEASDAELDQAWNAMLLDIPKARLEAIEALRGRYQLYVLSNTNTIHVHCFERQLAQVSGRPRYWDFFDAVVYSQEVGMRKPEERIYRHVEKLSGLAAKELFFIDDTLENIEAAQSLGWQAYHLQGELTELDIFRDPVP